MLFCALLVSCQCNDSVNRQWLSSHSLLTLSFIYNTITNSLIFLARLHYIFKLLLSNILPRTSYMSGYGDHFTSPSPSHPLPLVSPFVSLNNKLMYGHCINTSRYTNIEWGNVHKNNLYTNEATHQNTILIYL